LQKIIYVCIFYTTLLYSVFSQKTEPVTFLCLNDFHAQTLPIINENNKKIGGSALIAGYINHYKKQGNALWIIAGDYFQGTPIDSITKGKALIEILNTVKPDIFTLGNHEFDHGLGILQKRIEEAQFPIISANIKWADTKKHFTKPYIIKKIKGLEVLFIGVILENLKDITGMGGTAGLEILPAKNSIEEICREHNDIDLTVVVSHIGFAKDKRLARQLNKQSGVDIIIGGHSHKKVKKPSVINNIIVVQSGDKGTLLGKLAIVSHKWELMPVTLEKGIKPDPKIETLVKTQEQEISKTLDVKIGTLPVPLTNVKKHKGKVIENNLGYFAVDSIMEELQVDIAFQNQGGLRKSLKEPDITIRDIWEILRDIWEIFPFDNHWVIFKLSAKDLWTLLETNIAFKGEYLFFSGSVAYKFDSKKAAGKRLKEVRINGKKISKRDTKKYFTCTTVNYIFNKLNKFGLDIKELKKRKGFTVLKEKNYRDYYIDYIKKHGVITAKLDGRVQDIAK
jgi:5'-nucleotidase